MAFTFPTSPSVNDTVTLGGLVYIWNGSSWETQVVNLGVLSINDLSDIDFNSVTLDGSNGSGKVLAWDQSLQAFAPIDQSGASTWSALLDKNNVNGPTFVALGKNAGNTNQGANSIAIGEEAAHTNQGAASVAIGYLSGGSTQGSEAVAIGDSAGNDTQGNNATAIGNNAGETNQGASSVAIGDLTGNSNQSTLSVAIGPSSGQTSQGSGSVSIGNNSGTTTQGDSSVAIGNGAGQTTQGLSSVAIGVYAGKDSQGANAVAIGQSAGITDQGMTSVAIGMAAGNLNQGIAATAVGKDSGTTNQSTEAVAVGQFSGNNNQDVGAVAVGSLAGTVGQGENSIAIGKLSGPTNQASNSIVINATGSALENTTSDSFVIKPIRQADGTSVLEYDETTGEVSYVQKTFIELTDLSVTTAAASTTPSLAYDDGTGVFTYTPPDLGNSIVSQSEYSSTITTNASDTSETGSYILGNTGSASATGSSTGWFFGDIVQDPDNPGTSIILDVDSAIFGPGTTLGNHDGNVRTPTGSHTILDVGTDGTDGTLTITNITADGTLDFSGATVTGVVAGSDTQIQFNNSGSFGADANLIFNSSEQRVVVGSGGTGKFEASNFMGHADQTTYVSSKTTGSESTHFALNSTSEVTTDIYGFSTFQGNVCFEKQIQEKFSTINAATGTVTHDLDNGQVFRHTSPSCDFTANLTNISLTGDHAMTITLIIEQGATAFIASAIQIGGVAQTITWQGGIVPSGTDNGVDIISFSILNTGTTGSPSYLAMGQLVDFT